MSNTWQFDVFPLDKLDALFKRAATLATSLSDDQSASKVQHVDSGTAKVSSTSLRTVVGEPRNVTIPTAANRNKELLEPLLPPKPSLLNKASDNFGFKNQEQRLSNRVTVPFISSMSAAGEPENRATSIKNQNKELSRLQPLGKLPLQNQANDESAKERTLDSNWRIGNKSAEENKEERPSDRNWRTTKGNSDRKNPDIKNQAHKKQQRDSFTVTGLLCQVYCKGSDKWFYVKVEDEPLTNERLKCYFRFLSDPSVPLIEYKTKFLLGVKFVSDYDEQPQTEQRIKVLWVNPLEYIKLTSSDVLEAFKNLPLSMTHEEIIQKFYFTWRKYLMALLSQAHQFDEEALTEILYFILPDDDESCRVVQAQEHQCRFQEIIKLLSSRESSFLLRLNQFDFIGNEELVKKLIELVATTNNSLNPVCHLLRRYYDDDIEGLLNLIEKCCKGFDTSLNSLAAQNFRDIPLIPVMEELKGVISAEVFGVSLNPTVQRLLQLESHLLPNRTVGPWKSPEEFLNVHFRLLREECFASIRDRIARVRSEPTNDQLVHRDVKLVSYAIGDGSIVVKIKFKPSKIRANLMFGNLLCLDVDTDFSNPIWATVKSANRGSEISISLVGVGNNYISGNYIDGLDGSPSARIVIPALQRLIATQSGVMVESPTYYHAFRPVLARLQTLTSSDFPFASEILVQSKVPQPSPITFVGTYNFPGLDDSQRLAAEEALKNRFSLIQGPPGCGKTFVGKEIVRTMLNSVHFVEEEETDEDEDENEDEDEFGILKLKSNSKSSVKEPKGPILVISYKNHALDSFLENCLKFSKDNSEPLSLARIGGRSTSEAIAKFDLHNQTQEMKNYFSKEKFMKLQDARTQLHDFAEKVEKTAAKSLISFTPSALIDFLLREQGTNGKQQLYSLMVRNFTENYRKIINQDYECDSPEEAVTDILNDHRTAEKILKSTLEQWLSEKESEKFLPKPQTSLFINTNQPKTIKDEDDGAEDDEEIEEDEWEEVVAERFVGSESKLKFNDILHKKVKIYEKLQKRLENREPDVREQEVCGVSDVWSLTYEGRYVLLSYWLREWRKEIDENLAEALDEYSNFYRQVQVLEQERNVEFLKSRDLIACTITGCCLRMGIIARVAPSIVIVEEAAEILESQLIAALPSSVKHVVLVGDHQQLPPQVHHYRLKTKFNLGISIFERLANNGYPVSQLRFHRRGPQSLCPLFARFYKQDIVATKKDPLPPPILARMGLFYWWTHEAPAQLSPNGTSFENEFEGAMLVGAVHLLIKIGRIDASKITVITGYLGQSKKIKQMLEKDEIQGVKVCTIDRYQGDENDFIFLSLTRSVSEKTDCESSLGFLASPNRTCVALSRARKGLYVFGCSSLFQYHPTWYEIVRYFRERSKLGRELPFNVSGKLLSFEHPNDFSLFFKELQLQEQEMKLKLYNQLSKELPELNSGIHDVTAEFGWKMENLMNNTILDKRDLGVGRDGDGKKYSGFKVTKVKRIFNKDMYLTYLHHLKRIEDSKPPPLGFEVDTKTDWMVSNLKLNKRANEVFLFHGTKRGIVDIIAEGGFDERVARNGMFGAGIYFAENADKSDQYTDRSNVHEPFELERFIFLARVTLGNPKKILKSDNQLLRRPPPIDPKKPVKLYDSVIAVSGRKSGVVASVKRHQEFIIFDRYQCLPEFIIHYCRRY